jgi:hypothetical protein
MVDYRVEGGGALKGHSIIHFSIEKGMKIIN